ncbi:MAG: threonine synthase [Actinomycetota bacterium]|jgi:threonine synthase|uniref:threonine synthase n=1 Tax=uncultured Ilumatobacter sp. TaxID=879968 RepID=UPI00374EE58E|nr:threonine synthase [Actinomycetota bacterium]
MKYVSTRGDAPVLGFSDVLLAGLAADGGLYMPEEWPTLTQPSTARTYVERAVEVMLPFVEPDIDELTLTHLATEAYSTFRHPAVVPLVQIDHNQWVQELFHGPTLAFKDVALQLVGKLFDHVLAQRGERVTIVGATSGDTGSAAIDGVLGCENIDIVILYPLGRTSDVQRKQMTTVDAPNVHAVAVEGTFDDCQDMVKAMFNDVEFRQRNQLSAVNSINWARVMAQTVYYVTASEMFDEPVTFSVPTGNFGNVLAGWIARKMGAPIRDFIISSNTNDILTRFINDNDMSARAVIPSLSPSMDIQVSSNFERLLFEMNGRDGGMTAEQMRRFRATGKLLIEPDQRATFLSGSIRAAAFDDARTLAEIKRVYDATGGYVVEPHTATATAAARMLSANDGGGPVITLATAHPAKFPDAVEQATGFRPELPAHLADLFDREERTQTVANDLATVQALVEELTAR